MLTIKVGGTKSFDDSTQTFVEVGGSEIQLEHSLISLSKWESEFEKPFLGKDVKSSEEILAYIQYMIVSENPPEDFLNNLSKENLEVINTYIERKMTATWFSETRSKTRKTSEVITSELVYYWMTLFHIDFQCQYWHLNRLFTLIRICNEKQDQSNNKKTRKERQEMIAHRRAMNEQRKAQLGTTG